MRPSPESVKRVNEGLEQACIGPSDMKLEDAISFLRQEQGFEKEKVDWSNHDVSDEEIVRLASDLFNVEYMS